MFRTTVLGNTASPINIAPGCQCAQTERPYWLAESYADERSTDTGIVMRTINLTMRADLILSLLKIPDRAVCVDFGGASGLFTRMMCDKGHNFYRSEPFSQNFYAPFHDVGIRKAAVLTAFEVFEHLSEPAKEIAAIFEYSPDVLIVGTHTYTGQPADGGISLQTLASTSFSTAQRRFD